MPTSLIDTSETFSGDRLNSGATKRKRGERETPKGGGRNIPDSLPTIINYIPLGDEEKTCQECHKPFQRCEGKTSHQVDFKVIIQKVTTHRETCLPSCSCEGNTLVVAPVQPRAFPRCLFSDDAIVQMSLLKFDYAFPLNRTIKMFHEAGWENVSFSTLISNQRALSEYMLPLELEFINRNLAANIWQVDESGIPIFVKREGYQGFHWTLWQIQTTDTIVHRLTPTRTAKEIADYYSEKMHTQATVVADRAKVYQTLPFLIAFCWAHVRRDFIKLGRYRPGNKTFAGEWLSKIRKLYQLFKKSRHELENDTAKEKLRQHVQSMNADFIKQLADEKLNTPRRKVLESLQRHWHGLILFLNDDRIPLDNNAVERMFRPLANFRKSSFGCHSQECGNQAARFFTVLQTLKINGISAKPYILAYLQAAVDNGAKAPKNISDWMPWSMTDEVRQNIQDRNQ